MYERLIADLIVKGILLCSDSTAGGGEKSVHQRACPSSIGNCRKNSEFIAHIFASRNILYRFKRAYFGIQYRSWIIIHLKLDSPKVTVNTLVERDIN